LLAPTGNKSAQDISTLPVSAKTYEDVMEDYDALGTAKYFVAGEKWKDAKAVLDLVRPYATTIGQLDGIGKLYSECRDWSTTYEIALYLFNVVTTDESRNNARHSMIRALINLNKPEAALELIKDQPPSSETTMNEAMALFMCDRKRESRGLLERLLHTETDPETINKIRFNLAIYKFTNGQFREGMRDFVNYGRKIATWKKSPLPADKEWDGKIVQGIMELIIVAEGGIGDEIINVRFMRTLKELGVDAIWYTDREDLADVFSRNGFPCITDLSLIKRLDAKWCYSMALPAVLGVYEHELWYGPYLKAQGSNKPLPGLYDDKQRPNVGFKLSGNPDYEQDLHRSLPRKRLIHDLDIQRGTFYDFGLEDEESKPWVTPLREHLKTWDDTLNYLDKMAIVVTSCTSIAHAASAMGKKTVVLVPIMNYYVWAKPGEHSPWYSDNTTIIRQTEPGNWDKPLKELQKYLDENL
jgi:hypothetical protein